MKSIFNSLYGLYIVTAVITHIWTVIIGFTEGGLLGGILTLVLPVLAELYWMFAMFGENNAYAFFALANLIFAIPITLFAKMNE